jgi:hypothetical protein
VFLQNYLIHVFSLVYYHYLPYEDEPCRQWIGNISRAGNCQHMGVLQLAIVGRIDNASDNHLRLSHRIAHASPMHRPCIVHASSMHRPCIANASTMHRQCIDNASTMHRQCIDNASTMHRECIASPLHHHHFDTWLALLFLASYSYLFCLQINYHIDQNYLIFNTIYMNNYIPHGNVKNADAFRYVQKKLSQSNSTVAILRIL